MEPITISMSILEVVDLLNTLETIPNEYFADLEGEYNALSDLYAMLEDKLPAVS